MLEGLAQRGAACVVVENDLRLKRHPEANLDRMLLTGFVGERVIHWASLAGGTDDAVLAVHRGASGAPKIQDHQGRIATTLQSVESTSGLPGRGCGNVP